MMPSTMKPASENELKPVYMLRARLSLFKNFVIPHHAMSSLVTHAPGLGYLLPTRNLNVRARPMNSGREEILGAFDVFLIKEDGSYELLISGLDSYHDCSESIKAYLSAKGYDQC